MDNIITLDLPDKLIGVGMRFFDGAQRFLDGFKNPYSYDRGIYDNIKITIHGQGNEKGISDKALLIKVNSKPVAWVRNKDLLEYFDKGNALEYMTDGTVFDQYKLAAIYPNYIVLHLKQPHRIMIAPPLSVSTAKYPVIEDFAFDKSEGKKVPIEIQGVFTGSGTTTSIQGNLTTKGDKMNVNNLKNSFFREVSVAMDLQSGKIGIKNNEGIATFEADSVNVNPITELSVELPAFAIRTDVKELKAGDIVYNANAPLFFKGVNDAGVITAVNTAGEVKTLSAVSNLFFGKNTVLAVRNFFNGTSDPMMMALLFSGDTKGNGIDLKTFALMNMFNGKTDGNNNALMMAMLLSK